MNDFDDMSLLEDIYNFEFESVNIARGSLQTMLQYEMYGDVEVMMEGVRDIFSNMAAAIRKLIDAITGFFSKFLRIFQAHSMDHAKFCDKWGDDIIEAAANIADDKNNDVILRRQGYDFKVMERPDPNMKSFDKVIEDYKWALMAMLPMASADNMGDAAATKGIADYKADTNEFLSDTHLDQIRGEVLGTNKPIQADDFNDAIHEFYYGSKEPLMIPVTEALVRKIVDRADDLKKMYNRISSNKMKIIALLKKAEAFFSKKAELAYENGRRVVNTQDFNYDDDGAVRTHSTKNQPAEKYLADVNVILNLTYSKTKAVASIINTVITEQSRAISDLVRQDRGILYTVPGGPSLKNDTIQVSDATNYINMDRLSEYASYHAVVEGLNHEMLLEGAWLETAYESGVTEDVVIESKIGTILGDAAQKLIRKFREINIRNMQARSPWYSNKDVMDAIIAAAKDKDMTLNPMWTGKYSNADTVKVARLATLVTDTKSDLSGYSWANDFVSVSKEEDLNQDGLDKKLLNYFLFGKKDTDKVSPVKLSGEKLSSTVADMFKYLNSYNSTIQSTTTTLTKAVTAAYKVTESFGVESYSNLLGMSVRDTDLSVLFEDTANESGTGQKNSGVVNANRGVATEKESGASMSRPIENKTPTDGSNKSQTRAIAARFVKRVIRAYITSIEMRFVLYFNTINACAPSGYRYKDWQAKQQGNSDINKETAPKTNTK